MKKILVNDKVKVKMGVHEGEVATVTTIVTTNRKRFYVTFSNGEVTSYFYKHLTKVNS